MDADRIRHIVDTGAEYACRQLSKHPNCAEYPHDFNILYGQLEEVLYSLYDAIELKRLRRILNTATDIVVIASEILELACARILQKDLKEGKI